MGTRMIRNLLCIIALLFCAAATAGNDIWASLFRETLQQARQGDSEAQYNVGAMYQNGRGVTSNRDKAVEWYGKAAEQGNSKAVSRLELMKANQASFSNELQQAEQGHTDSQYNIGNMFAKGNGTNMDLKQAFSWYEKAASQGHIKAAYKLGLAHYEASGVNSSGKQAVKWLSIAAADDYAPAQYYLGRIYAEGKGVRKDYSKALGWFTKAVDGGFDQARAEMIDVTERMKMKATSRKPAKQVKKPAKTVKKKKAEIKNTASGKEATTKTVTADAPAAAQTMENLMLGTWNRNEKPVAWLPSSINNCRSEAGNIICFSDDQVRDTGSNTIKFKTKSIISRFTDAGGFNITYRNLVINTVTNAQDAGDAVSAFDEAAEEKGYAVQTGWGKEHRLECLLTDSTAVKCKKNKTHAMLITSQQQLANSK